MAEKLPGAAGTVSQTDWSNSAISREYVEEHPWRTHQKEREGFDFIITG